jgi:hypothetical protein
MNPHPIERRGFLAGLVAGLGGLLGLGCRKAKAQGFSRVKIRGHGRVETVELSLRNGGIRISEPIVRFYRPRPDDVPPSDVRQMSFPLASFRRFAP